MSSLRSDPAGVGPVLVVRTRQSDHRLRPGTSYRLGRDPKSDIVVTDTRVSWRHAVLRNEQGAWILEDVGSTNGTFVDAQRVSRFTITVGCVVRLGDSDDGPVIRCEPADEPVHAPTEVAGRPVGAVLAPGPIAPERPRDDRLVREDGGQRDRWSGRDDWDQRGVAAGVPAGRGGGAGRPSDGSGGASGGGRAGLADRAGGPGAPVGPGGPGAPGGASRAAEPEDYRLSVDRRPTAILPLPVRRLRIGRTSDNDLVLSDLAVSHHHAELRKSGNAQYEIVDLGSHNGTFVNGQRVTSATLTEQDIVSIGHATFRLTGDELREYIDTGDVSLVAQDLVVRVSGGKVLLDHVSFPIAERCLLGIIGPSGAGKSTLLGALTGMRPADHGVVLYDNRDLYRDYAELRHRIGLVPQDSIMHTQLTTKRALRYAAELRFPADTHARERNARVDEVMGELALTRHGDTRADKLSGGQLKRVNVALELLTKPSLLFLDEPTSGLDPGLDKSVMEQMRDLAHDGRTVIVVTHSVANLDVCDRLLVLVPGGKVAFYGPPQEGLSYFGQPGWAEVFQSFEQFPDRDWAGEFARSHVCAQYVTGPQTLSRAPDGPIAAGTPRPPMRRGRLHQVSTLCRRYARVIAADRGYLLFMGLMPIVLGALTHALSGPQGLAGGSGTNTSAQQLLLVLVVSACLAGTASSVRELVKERSIFVRERAAGLSSGAYLASKLVVLGVISVVQVLILTGIGLAGLPMPAHGAFLTNAPLAELLIGIAVLGVVSMCLGLLVSALVSTSEKAMPFLVLLTMAQVILSGGVIAVAGKAGLAQLSWLAPARWGFGAVASTVDLTRITPMSAALAADPLWKHQASTWLTDMVAAIALAVVFSLIAWWRLNRLSPGRRR
jgi:ABC transport system ATP-binding/permease protein